MASVGSIQAACQSYIARHWGMMQGSMSVRSSRLCSMRAVQLTVAACFALTNIRSSNAFQLSTHHVVPGIRNTDVSGVFCVSPMARVESKRPNTLQTPNRRHSQSCAGSSRTNCRRTLSMSAGSSVEGVRALLGSSSIASVMQAANSVPPVYYFVYLLAAGVGVPVSEDVLLIFVGTLLGRPDFTVRHKVSCVAWCYAGVVLSDYLTYGIGAGLRRGLFNPLRRFLLKDVGNDLTTGKTPPTSEAESTDITLNRNEQGTTERLLERIRRSGRWVGVAERFALGIRGPMTLLCGFTGVPFKAFAGGVALGALLGTVPIQLALGHALRNRPSAVGGIGAAVVSLYALGPPIVGAAGAVSLWLSGKGKSSAKQAPGKDVQTAAGLDR